MDNVNSCKLILFNCVWFTITSGINVWNWCLFGILRIFYSAIRIAFHRKLVFIESMCFQEWHHSSLVYVYAKKIQVTAKKVIIEK